MEPLEIGVLLSGSGTNLQAIIDAVRDEGLPMDIWSGAEAVCGRSADSRRSSITSSSASCRSFRLSRRCSVWCSGI